MTPVSSREPTLEIDRHERSEEQPIKSHQTNEIETEWIEIMREREREQTIGQRDDSKK